MNAKTLLPILIALHVAAAALIVDGMGLRIEQSETAQPAAGSQAVEWSAGAGCGSAGEDFARLWSGAASESNTTGATHQACTQVH
jgi:hypothetical protein